MNNKPEQPHDDFETQIQCEEVYGTEPESENVIDDVGGYGSVNMDQLVGDKNKLIMVYVNDEGKHFGLEPSEIEHVGTPIDENGDDMTYVGMGFH